MIIALWILTGLLAVAFVGAGTMKALRPHAALAGNMPWVEDVTPPQLKAIGILELLGGLGLVLPAATGILPWLTPVAAFALTVTMGVAVALHVKRSEGFVPSLVLGILSAVVGVGWIVLG
ncbi:DoxX family protein [Agromyces sp. LHK192]|uniref:DoxX family protein n=1 Tax=Agromyces sp. LHK192 TaxID=2498704 RepID=UPI000FDB4B8C|nr:DoxX family protein [Agromyces sp. LHK192]